MILIRLPLGKTLTGYLIHTWHVDVVKMSCESPYQAWDKRGGTHGERSMVEVPDGQVWAFTQIFMHNQFHCCRIVSKDKNPMTRRSCAGKWKIVDGNHNNQPAWYKEESVKGQKLAKFLDVQEQLLSGESCF